MKRLFPFAIALITMLTFQIEASENPLENAANHPEWFETIDAKSSAGICQLQAFHAAVMHGRFVRTGVVSQGLHLAALLSRHRDGTNRFDSAELEFNLRLFGLAPATKKLSKNALEKELRRLRGEYLRQIFIDLLPDHDPIEFLEASTGMVPYKIKPTEEARLFDLIFKLMRSFELVLALSDGIERPESLDGFKGLVQMFVFYFDQKDWKWRLRKAPREPIVPPPQFIQALLNVAPGDDQRYHQDEGLTPIAGRSYIIVHAHTDLRHIDVHLETLATRLGLNTETFDISELFRLPLAGGGESFKNYHVTNEKGQPITYTLTHFSFLQYKGQFDGKWLSNHVHIYVGNGRSAESNESPIKILTYSPRPNQDDDDPGHDPGSALSVNINGVEYLLRQFLWRFANGSYRDDEGAYFYHANRSYFAKRPVYKRDQAAISAQFEAAKAAGKKKLVIFDPHRPYEKPSIEEWIKFIKMFKPYFLAGIFPADKARIEHFFGCIQWDAINWDRDFNIKDDPKDESDVLKVGRRLLAGFEQNYDPNKEALTFQMVMDSDAARLERKPLISPYRKQLLTRNRVLFNDRVVNARIKPTTPNGNCGFEALGITRQQYIQRVLDAVQHTHDWQLIRWIADAIVELGADDVEEWARRFNHPGHWMNELHLRILSRLFGLRIHVFMPVIPGYPLPAAAAGEDPENLLLPNIAATDAMIDESGLTQPVDHYLVLSATDAHHHHANHFDALQIIDQQQHHPGPFDDLEAASNIVTSVLPFVVTQWQTALSLVQMRILFVLFMMPRNLPSTHWHDGSINP